MSMYGFNQQLPHYLITGRMYTEIDLTAAIGLVNYVYLAQDDHTVVVELKIDPKADMPYENLLFFPVTTFSADKVRLAIFKLQSEYRQRKLNS